MAELKTKVNDQSVQAFIAAQTDEARRQDCQVLLAMMQKVTGAAPRMWGDAIVGFGDYHYRYASGREGDWFKVGFAPRKQNLTLYLSYNLEDMAGLLAKLGKHKTGVGCVYIKRLADVDLGVLEEMIERAAQKMS